jgi:hypothetical protein
MTHAKLRWSYHTRGLTTRSQTLHAQDDRKYFARESGLHCYIFRMHPIEERSAAECEGALFLDKFDIGMLAMPPF